MRKNGKLFGVPNPALLAYNDISTYAERYRQNGDLMELIKISDGRLKIMLTPPDMEKYHLDSESIDCADEHTREAFKHIFDDARAQVDFDTDGNRLFIQLYTSRGGGCEIFVTKIDNPKMQKTDGDKLSQKERELLERITSDDGKYPYSTKEIHSERQGQAMNISAHEKEDRSAVTVRLRQHPFVFAFDGIPPLISVCKQLLGMGFEADSSAYIDENDVTYLVLALPSSGFYRLPDRYAFIAEFGKRITSEGVDARLCEHTTPLCLENAVKTLANC